MGARYLAECGFTHDSSIYPIAHDRYGIPGFERHAHLLEDWSGPIFEVPIASVKLSGGQVAPVGGGGYLRLLPYSYTAAGIRRMNRAEEQPACIYFHPWEIDPDIPRLAVGPVAHLRTYMGLKGMERKIDRLLNDFVFSNLTEAFPITASAQGIPESTEVISLENRAMSEAPAAKPPLRHLAKVASSAGRGSL